MRFWKVLLIAMFAMLKEERKMKLATLAAIFVSLFVSTAPAVATDLEYRMCDSAESPCDTTVDDIGDVERETGITTDVLFNLDWVLAQSESEEELCAWDIGFEYDSVVLLHDWDGGDAPKMLFTDPQADVIACITTGLPDSEGIQRANCHVLDTTDDGTGLLIDTSGAELAVTMLVTGASRIGADSIVLTTLSSKKCWTPSNGCNSCADPQPRVPGGGIDFAVTSWDNCAEDDDADGYCDDASPDVAVTLHDNCVGARNLDQKDTDGDGYGNLCDEDVNNDCLVGGPDVGLVFNEFGAGPGNDWHGDAQVERMDVNGDGAVGGDDLGQVFNAFGTRPGPTVRDCADCESEDPNDCP